MGPALSLHLLAAVIWVGGMFFAYVFLRPSLKDFDAGVRADLWVRVLGRFFAVVWILIPLLLVTGFYMVYGVMGGLADAGPHVHIMLGCGILMMLLFMHVFFAPFKRLKRAVAAGDAVLAARQIGMIRKLVAVNLSLGLIIVLVASGGRYIIG